MFRIGKTLVSEEILENNFHCNIEKCKGACCVDGDAGAPLTDDELEVLSKIFDEVKPYMRQEGITAIEQQGMYVVDADGDNTTALINNKECAFVSFDQDGTAKCSIEQAYNDGKIEFKKPISCHLFPIRVKKYRDFEAVNYESIDICQPACECGQKLQVPVYRFLKEPLIRSYGVEWFDQLSEAARLLKKE